MHFFILQFLSSFALYMAFAQLFTGLQFLFFTRQAVLGDRHESLMALLGFFITGIIASIFIAFIPNLYFNFIEPYTAYVTIVLIILCFFYCFICLTNRFIKGKDNAIVLFMIGVLLAIICFVFYASFLTMFAISLGRIGVTSYISENFAITIGSVFIILSFIYYYLILIFNITSIKKQLYKIHYYLDLLFSVGFAAIGFWLLH